MIIYGRRSTHLKSVQLSNETCPCNTKGSMTMSVFNQYAHVFWIPLFPVGRDGGSQCMNCKQVLNKQQMPKYLRLQYDQMVGQTSVPIWSWTGLAALIVLIALGSYSASVDKDNEKKYIEAPMVGDIYEWKTDGGGYSLMKVAEVTSDSLLVHLNRYEVDQMTAVYKLRSKGYDSIGYWMSRETIASMYQKKDIFGVDR
jgi:hypothetical protein